MTEIRRPYNQCMKRATAGPPSSTPEALRNTLLSKVRSLPHLNSILYHLDSEAEVALEKNFDLSIELAAALSASNINRERCFRGGYFRGYLRRISGNCFERCIGRSQIQYDFVGVTVFVRNEGSNLSISILSGLGSGLRVPIGEFPDPAKTSNRSDTTIVRY